MRTSSARTIRPHRPRSGVDLHHEIHGRADSRDPAVVLHEDVERMLARRAETAGHVGLWLGGAAGLALGLRAPGSVRSLTLVNAFARLRPGDLGGARRGLERVVWLCVTDDQPDMFNPAVLDVIAAGG